ncbi:MAG TPA: nucleotidyltransferase family protein [Rhizomicrobium sp.]|jgi:molybdenum cofactor cytidylyltransferase
MIAPPRVAALLLAAGRSVRFGEADKLAYNLDGVPLGLHAGEMLLSFPFAIHIAVISESAVDYAGIGFSVVRNDAPSSGQSHSIRLGIAEVISCDVDAVLIALADMPFVTASHVGKLLTAYNNRSSIVGSLARHACPPVLFGRDWFDALRDLTGDRGAGAFLRGAMLIPADDRTLADIDAQDDLAAPGILQV